MSEYTGKDFEEEDYSLVEDDELLDYESAAKKIHIKNSLRAKELKILEAEEDEESFA